MNNEELLLSLKEKIKTDLAAAKEVTDIESLRVAYLGKKGSITDLLKCLKDLSEDERKSFGQKVNLLK